MRGLNEPFLAFTPLVQPGFVTRLKSEQAAIRKALVRIDAMRTTSFVAAGYVIAELTGGVGADAVPAIVFVTAYDRYAVRAFEAHAVDYLLKPIDSDRFREAWQRAAARVEQERDEPDQRVAALVGREASRPLAALRVAFAFDPERMAVLLTGGNKSGVGQRTFYAQLIERADRLFAARSSRRCSTSPASG